MGEAAQSTAQTWTGLEAQILNAMGELGREPNVSRIARKAKLPLNDAGNRLAPQSVAAFEALLRAGAIRPGTRGGFRLPEKAKPWQQLV